MSGLVLDVQGVTYVNRFALEQCFPTRSARDIDR